MLAFTALYKLLILHYMTLHRLNYIYIYIYIYISESSRILESHGIQTQSRKCHGIQYQLWKSWNFMGKVMEFKLLHTIVYAVVHF